jgi:hypothetical protein
MARETNGCKVRLRILSDRALIDTSLIERVGISVNTASQHQRFSGSPSPLFRLLCACF